MAERPVVVVTIIAAALHFIDISTAAIATECVGSRGIKAYNQETQVVNYFTNQNSK